jgi:cytochrome d ubiquinol oxidase subunit II
MSTINWLFEVNFAIFSVFVVLFLTELMGGVLLLVAYDATKSKVLPYIVPIWEVTGTFAAFWVVTADFAYPNMLIPVANLFAGLIVVFLILFVARNASISFAELITKRGWVDEKKLYQAYGLATVLIGLVVLIVVSTIVSGAGVNLGVSPPTFSLWGWLTNPGSLLYGIGVVVLGVGLAPVFYDIAPLRRLSLLFTGVGVVIEAGALYLYSASFLSGYFLIPALLAVLASLLYQTKATAALVSHKLVFALVATIIIFSTSYLVYPTAFHGATAGPLSVDAVTTSGPMVGAFYVLTAVGIVVVGFLMAVYLLAVRHAAQGAAGRGSSAPTPSTPQEP